MASSVNNDLENLEQFLDNVTVGAELTVDIAKELTVLGKNTGIVQQEELSGLMQTMENYVKLKESVQAFIRAASAVHKEDQPISSFDINEALDKALKKQKKQPDLALQSKYQELVSIIEASEENNEELEEEVVDSESGLTMSIHPIIPKDPISLQEVKDPVKNKYCEHTYERSTIMSYIQSKSKPRCPQVGCGNSRILRACDLVDDHELKRRIAQKKKE